MSDDYHRPTYTTKDPHDAFNATQVRLYGIPGLPRPPKTPKKKYEEYEPKELPRVRSYIYKRQTAMVLAGLLPGEADNEIDNYIKSQALTEETNSSYLFVNSIVEDYMVMIGTIDLYPDREESRDICKKKKKKITSGIIFAYAYEGHTYELPKPKIMLIPTEPEPEVPPDDSGYDRKNYADYTVWIVDKLDQCVEFEMNQGFVEQLVLEANLPGKRSPTMYASRFMMGHRGGKLND